MSEVPSSLQSPIDAGLGGVLLANMVETWLAGNPDCWASGCGVCVGSLAAGALESRLVPSAGVVRAYRDAGDRRRRLLRSVGFQRRPLAWIEGDHGAGRAPFFARAPPGR